MGELGLGMFLDIEFHLFPLAFRISNSFAGGTGRNQTTEGLDTCQGLVEVTNKGFSFFFHLFTLINVAGDHNAGDYLSGGIA